ncbi:MAG: tRNA (adenine-N1)-methyltransferase [Thermoplasmata archaeon]|nr:MAG: tRNA (adenine-N1)-methyltransferase [Thermoplasmata archaeon]
MPDTVSESDLLMLMDKKGNKVLVSAEPGAKKIRGLGVYDPEELIGKEFGDIVPMGNREFVILKPSIADKVSAAERKAQIILPKDGVFIIHFCGIKSGDIVVEGGAGSGALTILLAHAVMPEGKVISYEIREDFARIAKRNVQTAGLKQYVEIEKADVTEGISQEHVDAVVLDIPNPWDAVKNAHDALKLGGHLASYSPTVNQVEGTVRAMKECGFFGVRTVETLQREMVVGKRGTRPSFDMLGHTGYVTYGRKIGFGPG